MTRRRPIHGWLNLAKPLGMSSAQAVGAAKRILRPEKIGHAGTLDPLASGVLPLALGCATKTVSFLMDASKDYRFTVSFGVRTSTDDREGEAIATHPHRPGVSDIHEVLQRFTGEISQVPPCYSALKLEGKRAYALARAGEEVNLAPRKVRIDRLELLGTEGSETASFRVTCGKGTYVRSLARDIAQALGTEGHVSELIRERVGPFTLSHAISLAFLEETVHKAGAPEGKFRPDWVWPIRSLLDDIPACELDAACVGKLRTGQGVPCDPALRGEIAAVWNGEVVALGLAEAGLFKPRRVFNDLL